MGEHEWRQVKCPVCGAEIGKPCKTIHGDKTMAHQGRIDSRMKNPPVPQ